MFAGNSRFKLVRKLGAGGMGVVYEAMDEHRKMKVALKTLPHTNADLLYRLKREFRSLRDIVHPNLVRLDELVEDSGHWFFTMELLEGENLQTHFRRIFQLPLGSHELSTQTWLPLADTKRERPGQVRDGAARPPEVADGEHDPRRRQLHVVDFERIRTIFMQIAKGLAALHEDGQIHRDIKPSNIMITQDGRVVILDFGLVTIASDADAEVSREGEIVGTAAYMAPEQAAARVVGPAADWYSVGVMLYEVITGRRPFEGNAVAIMTSKQASAPRGVRALSPQCPSDLAELCMGLLLIEPDHRLGGPDVLRCLGQRDASEPRAHAPSLQRNFVGRASELGDLQHAFDDVGSLVTVAVFVHGESGVGKSTLIRQFLTTLEAQRSDVVVLTGQCREHEAVPFKGMDGIIDALSRYICRLPAVAAAELVPQNAALLPTMFPVLGRIPAIAKAPRPVHAPSDPFQQRKRVFAALREMISLLAERHRLVWFIDDIQWIDSDSLNLLGELLRPPEQPRLLLLTSVRSSEVEPALPQICDEGRRIRLTNLTSHEADTLTRMLLDSIAPEHKLQVARIVEESAGHPLFIGELVRYSAAAGGTVKQLRLDEAIWTRASHLDVHSVKVLEILSVAIAPLSEEVLQIASRLEIPEVQRAIAVLRANHLIRAAVPIHSMLEVYHDRIRQAVMAHVDDAERVGLNEQLAIALEISSGTSPPEVLIYHLEGAQQLDKAAHKAFEAANRALGGLAFEQAIKLYDAALRLTEWPVEEKRAIQIKLAGALGSAGRGPEAAAMFTQAAEGADPITQLNCRIQVADQLMQSGHLDRGVTLLFSLFDEHGHRVPASQARIAVRIIGYRMRLAVKGLRWTEKSRNEIHPRDLAVLSLYKAASRGLILVDTIRAAYFVIRGMLMAMRVGDRESFMYFLALEAGFRGSEAKGAHHTFVERADALMSTNTDPEFQPIHRLLLGGRAYLSTDGRFREGIEILERADEPLAQTANAAWELYAGRFFQTFCLQKLGDFPRLREVSEKYVRDATERGNLYNRTTINRLRNILWLVEDDPAGARDNLQSDSWASEAGGYHLQHWLELHARAEIAIYEGVPLDADLLARHLKGIRRCMLLRVLSVRCDTAWMLGRLALADNAPARTVRRSIAKLHDCATLYALTCARMLGGTLAIKERDFAGAVKEFREAIAVGERCKVQYLTAIARRRLGEMLTGDEGRALTADAEAWMTAAGIKNFERMSYLVSPYRTEAKLEA